MGCVIVLVFLQRCRLGRLILFRARRYFRKRCGSKQTGQNACNHHSFFNYVFHETHLLQYFNYNT